MPLTTVMMATEMPAAIETKEDRVQSISGVITP
jgi:hypothetical protein